MRMDDARYVLSRSRNIHDLLKSGPVNILCPLLVGLVDQLATLHCHPGGVVAHLLHPHKLLPPEIHDHRPSDRDI